jgi:hypothetical protein
MNLMRHVHFGQPTMAFEEPKMPRGPLCPISNGILSAPVIEGIPIDPDEPSQLIVEPFIHVELPIGSPADPQDIAEYEHIVYRSMRIREVHFPEALVEQCEISPRDRSLLVDWMCRLHYKAQITTESFFRAVGILDRAIALVHISPHRFHIIGAAAMLIASKIEDTRPVSTDDVVTVSSKEFSADDLKRMELQLINLIQFDTEFPTPLFFLTLFMTLNGQSKETILLARYLLELAMTTPEFMGVRASAIAASAVMMTRTLAGIEPWTEEMAAYTQYGFEDLCQYVKIFHAVLLDAEREESSFVRRKYSTNNFCFVANVPIPAELPLPFPYYE